jgi:hypothetical protein
VPLLLALRDLWPATARHGPARWVVRALLGALILICLVWGIA